MDEAGFEGVDARRTVAGIHDAIVLVADESFPGQGFDGGEFGDPAGAGDAHHFAFEVAKFVDALRADQHLVDVCGMAADDDDIGAARNTGHGGDSRHDRVIGFTAQQCGHDHRSATHIDWPDIEPFSGENAEITRRADRQRCVPRGRRIGDGDGFGEGCTSPRKHAGEQCYHAEGREISRMFGEFRRRDSSWAAHNTTKAQALRLAKDSASNATKRAHGINRSHANAARPADRCAATA